MYLLMDHFVLKFLIMDNNYLSEFTEVMELQINYFIIIKSKYLIPINLVFIMFEAFLMNEFVFIMEIDYRYCSYYNHLIQNLNHYINYFN